MLIAYTVKMPFWSEPGFLKRLNRWKIPYQRKDGGLLVRTYAIAATPAELSLAIGSSSILPKAFSY